MGDTQPSDWNALFDIIRDNWIGIVGGVFAITLLLVRIYYPRYLGRRDAVREIVVRLIHHLEKLEPQLAETIDRRGRMKKFGEQHKFALVNYIWLHELDSLLEYMKLEDIHLLDAEYRQKLIKFQSDSGQVFGQGLDHVKWDSQARIIEGPRYDISHYLTDSEEIKEVLEIDERTMAHCECAYLQALRKISHDFSTKYKVATTVRSPDGD